MSAAPLLLPRLYAFAETASAVPAHAAQEPAGRKGPHSLRLVRGLRAHADYIEPKRLPASIGGVGYEFYRKYTEAMLRRYVKLSMEAGRVPSLLGRELFRGYVSSCRMQSFEDVSNFVLDVGRCLAELGPGQQHLVRRIALEEYTQAEAAAMLGMSLRTVVRRYAGALDKLTGLLLERKLLEPLAACRE